MIEAKPENLIGDRAYDSRVRADRERQSMAIHNRRAAGPRRARLSLRPQ
jgi:hypothetical protein